MLQIFKLTNMNTPLQTALEKLKEAENYFTSNDISGFRYVDIDNIEEIITSLFKEEREVIENSFQSGMLSERRKTGMKCDKYFDEFFYKELGL